MTDGDQDWMDPEGGRQAVENMEKIGNPDGRLYIVPGAGHHGTLLLPLFHHALKSNGDIISVPRQS